MYKIEVHKRINQISSLYYFMGLWHGADHSECRKRVSKIWYLSLYGVWPVVVIMGILKSDNAIDSMFLVVMAIPGLVILMRMCYLIWKKDEILRLIREMGTHSVGDREYFNEINTKINRFIQFASFYHFLIALGLFTLPVLALPIVSDERKLPLAIYFPLDWKNNSLFYFIAFGFVVYEFIVSMVFTIFNIILWYLMMSCVIEYQILGTELKIIGLGGEANTILKKNKIPVDDGQNQVLGELITLIKNHKKLQKTTEQIRSCFSNLYLVQIGTSGCAICGSVYLLAFSSAAENIFLYVVYLIVVMYQFFDIYMVTYLGNEIKYWSSRLSYRLFECNWVDQSKACKKCMVILMEVLKQPQVLVIGKLYPLDLEIFTNILNFAYSLFNILKNMK